MDVTFSTKRNHPSDSPSATVSQVDDAGPSKKLCHHDEIPLKLEVSEEIEPVVNDTPEIQHTAHTGDLDVGHKQDSKPQTCTGKKQNESKRKRNKKMKNKSPDQSLTTSEQSLEFSIKELMGDELYDRLSTSSDQELELIRKESGWELEKGHELVVTISALSSFGDGIAVSPNKSWALVVPFCVPGDVVKARIYRHASTHSLGDLISVIERGEWRNDDLVRCKYFGKCSGCQYQMIDYSKQLDLKRITVQRAFEHFSGLDRLTIPQVEPTLASPKQYEYRTKLTPHFELPRQMKNKNAPPVAQHTEDYNAGPGGLAIGLAEKGRRRVLDIEECPLGTPTINQKLTTERARIQSTIHTFKRGATLLLRESMVPYDPDCSGPMDNERRICVTDHKTIVREKVLDKIFEQNAGSFFQNNPSILGPFITYLVDQLIPKKLDETDHQFLVDAYCGSGLFSISLAQYFTQTIGIELSSDSLHYAKRNADLNEVKNASFIVGDAQAIFKDLKFPADKTTIIIDPPRKGCSREFLDQLMSFRPKRIIYISCNVHTQAQDISSLKECYGLQRLRGLDFFPQTYHCESVALLTSID